jgi:hypothetical protein
LRLDQSQTALPIGEKWTMNNTNWVTTLNSTIRDLLSHNSSQFLSLGLAIGSGLAVILIVRYGVATALAGRGLDFGDFFQEVILLIGACLCILRGYSTPMPLFAGRTFPDLIIDGPAQLANQISLTSDAQLEATFGSILEHIPPPINPLDMPGHLCYWIMQALIQGTRAVMFAIFSFGLIAQAVIVMLGPVFIPFLLFRPMSFMFWGWFRSLLQYSFYPVICSCFSAVLTAFFLNLPMSSATGALSMAQVLALSPFFIIIILGMLSVPLVVNGLFSGASGAGVLSKVFS